MKVRLALFVLAAVFISSPSLEASSTCGPIFQLFFSFSNEGRKVESISPIPSQLPQKQDAQSSKPSSKLPKEEPPKKNREPDSVELSEKSRLAAELQSYLSPEEIQSFLSGSRERHDKALQAFVDKIVDWQDDLESNDFEDRDMATEQLNKIGDLFLSLAKAGLFKEEDFSRTHQLSSTREIEGQSQQVFVAYFPRSKEISEYFSSQDAND